MAARIFQHRQYEVVAELIAKERAQVESIVSYDTSSTVTKFKGLSVLDNLVSSLADAFEKDNPNFDRRRFVMIASGQPYVSLTADVVESK